MLHAWAVTQHTVVTGHEGQNTPSVFTHIVSAWRFLTTLPHRRTGEHHTVPIISVEAYRSVRSRREHPEDARALLVAAEIQKNRAEAVEKVLSQRLCEDISHLAVGSDPAREGEPVDELLASVEHPPSARSAGCAPLGTRKQRTLSFGCGTRCGRSGGSRGGSSGSASSGPAWSAASRLCRTERRARALRISDARCVRGAVRSVMTLRRRNMA